MDLDTVSRSPKKQNHFTDNLKHNRTDVRLAVTTTTKHIAVLEANSK